LESAGGPEDKDGDERRQRTDAGMSEQQPGAPIGSRGGRDALIEVDARGQPGEQVKVVVTPAHRVDRQDERFQLGETALGPQFGAKS
jgi:hypothetical protein